MGLTPVYELGKPWPVGWADGLSSSGSSPVFVPYIEVSPRVEYQECRCCGTRTRDMAREQCTQCGASLIDQIE